MKEKYCEIVEKYIGYCGRMISASKSGYKERHPENIAVFNANLVTDDREKIWFGDIDITNDIVKLKKISIEINKEIFILFESDGRFENENYPLIGNNIISVKNGKIKIGKKYKEYFEIKDNIPQKKINL